jgi:hypothetical protein
VRVAIPLPVGLLAILAVSVLPAGPVRATILLFDQGRDASTQSIVVPTGAGAVLPADYGDNVTGAVMAVPGGFFTYGDGGEGFTPDVTVDIYSASGPTDPRVKLWTTGYGDLVNVVFGEGPGTGGSPELNVLLTASSGFAVDLYGFELGGWPDADYTIAAVEVFAGSVALFSATDVLVEGNLSGPRHTTFAFGTPLSAPQLLLRLDLSNLASGAQDNVGIDSIRFGQTPPRTVPEPATGLLLPGAIALAAAGRIRWRRAPGGGGRPQTAPERWTRAASPAREPTPSLR